MPHRKTPYWAAALLLSQLSAGSECRAAGTVSPACAQAYRFNEHYCVWLMPEEEWRAACAQGGDPGAALAQAKNRFYTGCLVDSVPMVKNKTYAPETVQLFCRKGLPGKARLLGPEIIPEECRAPAGSQAGERRPPPPSALSPDVQKNFSGFSERVSGQVGGDVAGLYGEKTREAGGVDPAGAVAAGDYRAQRPAAKAIEALPARGFKTKETPASHSSPEEQEGRLDRASAWLDSRVQNGKRKALNSLDAAFGFRSEEERLAAAKGLGYGAASGGIAGTVIGGGAAGAACAPALITGAPYALCVGAGAAGGGGAGTLLGGLGGGAIAVGWHRFGKWRDGLIFKVTGNSEE